MMAGYILAQAVSALAVIAVMVLAVRRYTARTDAALRSALDGIDATAQAVLGESARSLSQEVGLNGSHAVEPPALPVRG